MTKMRISFSVTPKTIRCTTCQIQISTFRNVWLPVILQPTRKSPSMDLFLASPSATSSLVRSASSLVNKKYVSPARMGLHSIQTMSVRTLSLFLWVTLT